MKLRHDTWVVVADGEKFLLLRNVGDEEYLRLEVVDHETSPNPAAQELASDRAGRRHDSTRQLNQGVTAWGKSGMEETDWHRVAEERFAEDIAEKLRDWVAEERFQRLVVIADPRTLGELRKSYDDLLKAVIIAEIDKDLTNLPLAKMEASITGYHDS